MDAPISGGPQRAKDGTLTIMCGGPQETYLIAEPVMKCMGSHVRLMGHHGAGTAAKLVIVNLSQTALLQPVCCAKHELQVYKSAVCDSMSSQK